MTKVVIDTAGPTITVESEAALDEVAAKALELYRETAPDWPREKPSIGAGTGFHSERSWE